MQCLVAEEVSSSGGDCKSDEDPDKRLTKDRDGKDRDREREDGKMRSVSFNIICFCGFAFESFYEMFALFSVYETPFLQRNCN